VPVKACDVSIVVINNEKNDHLFRLVGKNITSFE